MGPPASHGVPRAPCYSGTPTITEGSCLRIQDYHLLRSTFPGRSANNAFVTPYRRPQPPAPIFDQQDNFAEKCLVVHHCLLSKNRCGVWASPLSLAATYGVSVDFLSCRYLDVSVPCVGFTWPMHSARDDRNWLPSPAGLPHSEIPGLTVVRHLPRAYRSLPRPSSPLDTKTSPIHP